MGNIIEIIIFVSIAAISSWYYNTKSQPEEILIIHKNNVIEKYVYSPKYSCPYICEVNHIHFATDSLYERRLNK